MFFCIFFVVTANETLKSKLKRAKEESQFARSVLKAFEFPNPGPTDICDFELVRQIYCRTIGFIIVLIRRSR